MRAASGRGPQEGLIMANRHDELKADLEEVARMLSGLIKGLDKREG